MEYEQKSLIQMEWFQIALKTYFWVGFLFAVVFATSLGCLVATKYYHDQTVLWHAHISKEIRSFDVDMSRARETERNVNKVWYAVDQMKREIEANLKILESE